MQFLESIAAGFLFLFLSFLLFCFANYGRLSSHCFFWCSFSFNTLFSSLLDADDKNVGSFTVVTQISEVLFILFLFRLFSLCCSGILLKFDYCIIQFYNFQLDLLYNFYFFAKIFLYFHLFQESL